MISGKAAKRYPSVIVFFLNLLFFVASIGWMFQFFPDMRTRIVCKRDGTARRSEPQSGFVLVVSDLVEVWFSLYNIYCYLYSSGENHWCYIIFALVYFPTVASLVWFVILTYTWLVTQRLRDPQCARQVFDKQRSFFHLAAWCVPLVLSVACLTIAKVKQPYMTLTLIM